MESKQELLERIMDLEAQIIACRQAIISMAITAERRDTMQAESALTTLYRVWHHIPVWARLHFLIETLTPHERRIITEGLSPDEDASP